MFFPRPPLRRRQQAVKPAGGAPPLHGGELGVPRENVAEIHRARAGAVQPHLKPLHRDLLHRHFLDTRDVRRVSAHLCSAAASGDQSEKPLLCLYFPPWMPLSSVVSVGLVSRSWRHYGAVAAR
jgi:hypothetical protein